jgi:sugar-specific transcriptional regulator TrmB
MSSDLLYNSLTDLGLTDLDAQVYLFLISNTAATVTKLAQEFGKTRKQIYQSLFALSELNLVDPKKQYQRSISAASPSLVATLLKQKEVDIKFKLQKLEEILPDMVAQYGNRQRNPNMRVYEGRDNIISFYVQVSKVAEGEVLTFGSAATFLELQNSTLVDFFVQARVKPGVTARSLFFDNSRVKLFHEKDKQQLRQIRFLPNGFESDCTYTVHNQVLTIWNPVASKIIVIEDKLISDMFRTNFEMLWQSTEV